ncbi:MAG: hypothetical protein ABI442_01760 [Gemmatimonadaceae bacterium]
MSSTIAAAALGCGPAAGPGPTPTRAPAPVAAASPAPTVSQTCPDAADGASIIVQAIEDGHRAMAVNPTGPVPPACLITAFAKIAVVADTLNDHALGIAAELDRRGATPREVLPAEIALLSRARRYADLSRAYQRLVAVEPQPPTDVVRLAVVAAHQRGDTATLLRLLTVAEARPDAPPAFRAERNVVQQTGALYAAIAEARGLVRQNPRNLTTYPSLVGNFGTLGNADSVVAYIGRAVRQGVARASLAPVVDPFVNTMLRHAALYGDAIGWDARLASATRVDSALSTPSTKFLLASLLVHAAEPQIADLGPMIEGGPVSPGARPAWMQQRASACRRIPSLVASVDGAAVRLREGGDRYAGGGVQTVTRGIETERARLDVLSAECLR